MLFPSFKADPTEVMFALPKSRETGGQVGSGKGGGKEVTDLGALHVVASLILLNGRLAIRAWL